MEQENRLFWDVFLGSSINLVFVLNEIFFVKFFFSPLEHFGSIPIISGFGYGLTNVILFLFLKGLFGFNGKFLIFTEFFLLIILIYAVF